MIQKDICKWVRYIFSKEFKLYNNKCESNSALQSGVRIATMSSSKLGISYCFGRPCSAHTHTHTHTHTHIVDKANKQYTHIIQHEIFFDVHFSVLFMTKTF